MAECRALKPSDTEGNVKRATKSVISPESDAEVMQCDLCPAANLSGTEMCVGKPQRLSKQSYHKVPTLSFNTDTILGDAAISTAFDKTPGVLCTGPLFSTSAFPPAAMAEEHRRLPGQVRRSVRKSCSTVSHRQQRLQMLLGRVPDTVIRKKRHGSSVEELHSRVREQQREQERQKAIEAEARRLLERVPEKNGIQEASVHQAHSPPGLSVRKDSSPIKVRVVRCS
jgi:hypothetical protein